MRHFGFLDLRRISKICLLLAALSIATAQSYAQSLGQWTGVIPLPAIPIAAALLHNGKMLGWSAYDLFLFEGDVGDSPSDTYVFVRGSSGSTSLREVTNTGADMFCPGTAFLPNGTLLVNGGSSSPKTSIYDPSTNNWSSDAEMNVGRGYNADVMLDNGKVFTLGGSWAGNATLDKIGELWAPGQGWTRLDGISAQPITGPDPEDVSLGFPYRGDNQLWLFAVSGGRVFHAGPSAAMHWIATNGNGSISDAGPRADDSYSQNGNAVMYDIGKIFKTGGAVAYQDDGSGAYKATANTYDINITVQPVSVVRTADMTYPRAFANSVVLPTGQILVVGGQTLPVPFSDDNAILIPELWDPTTKTFRRLAPMETPRVYHSVALLLPDGRVFVGGGGQCGQGCPANHPDAEIFSPPYLFNADGTAASRPAISSSPSSGTYGEAVSVTTDVTVSSFVLMRLPSVTHTVDNDQRRVPLKTADASILSSAGTSYVLSLPADSGTAPPGYYMLFAIKANGVPSTGHMIAMD